MARFQSYVELYPDLAAHSKKGEEMLRKAGVSLPPNFSCTGLPWLCYEDFTKSDTDTFDLELFKGRISLGGNINASELSSFPAGPVRLTVGKMTSEPDDFGSITVGKTDLNHTSILSFSKITIGDRVHLEPRVIIQDCDGHQADRRLPDTVENKKRSPIVIEDDVWIGFGATILKGVTIGHHAVIKPGAVVMWSVPAHGVVAGNPAKNMAVFKKFMDPAPQKT